MLTIRTISALSLISGLTLALTTGCLSEAEAPEDGAEYGETLRPVAGTLVGWRVGYSADGNQHDWDDLHATPMSLALLHRAGLKSNAAVSSAAATAPATPR